MRGIRLKEAHSLLFSSKWCSYFGPAPLLLFSGLDAHERIVSKSSLGGGHVPCVKPAPPNTFARCWLPSQAEWARGPAPTSGLPCCPGQLSSEPEPAPRTRHLTAQEHLFAPGHKRPQGCQIPALHCGLYFLVTSYLWLRLFYKCHLIFF